MAVAERVMQITSTPLDQLMQVLEISFIFLITYSLIALADAAVEGLNLYNPIVDEFLGDPNIGSLNGGNWAAIVRITLILNLLLFGFSLTFGLWIRRTRDNWDWKRFGYTLTTQGYSFSSLAKRGFLLGLISVMIFYAGRTTVMLVTGTPPLYAFVYFTPDLELFTQKQLNAEYYFGIVEMGFIWPLSAGFFFFSYAHTSLNARFRTGVANILSTFFYVFYLQFFFLIPQRDKITQYFLRLQAPGQYAEFWIMSIALLFILYLNFSAFAETKSVIQPFIMNFVLNVGTTLIQAGNVILFGEVNGWVTLPVIAIALIVIIWWIRSPQDFSTIGLGMAHLKDLGKISIPTLIRHGVVFVLLSFFLPGVINDVLYYTNTGALTLPMWVLPTLYAGNFILIVILSIAVLTYEPTYVWDVLLVTKSGTPVASKIKLFETDDVLISGFFAALSAVDQELSSDGGLSSIKRGDREILIEDGVETRIIALVDRDRKSIRDKIRMMHRDFEIRNYEKLRHDVSEQFKEADDLVSEVGKLYQTFEIPTQTRWIGTISLLVAPAMILLIGLL